MATVLKHAVEDGLGEIRIKDDLVASLEVFWPTEVAVDVQGNLFVAGTSNGRVIRKVSVSGTITTIAGGGHSSDIDGARNVA